MIPNADLVCANDEVEAVEVSHKNPDFNVIPIRQDGKITGYFERDSGSTKKITPNDLISDGTSLLELVDILEHREFSFVLSSEKAKGYGYVHFSDLNHHLVKLTFYVIMAALERVALDSIRGKDDRESLRKHLSPGRFNYIEKKYKDAGEAARSLVSYLNIRELLKLAATAGTIRSTGTRRLRERHGMPRISARKCYGDGQARRADGDTPAASRARGCEYDHALQPQHGRQ